MTLAEQLVSSLNRAVPEATFERARSHVLDWVGCVLGAAREPLAQQISSLVSINSGQFPSFGIGPLDANLRGLTRFLWEIFLKWMTLSVQHWCILGQSLFQLQFILD